MDHLREYNLKDLAGGVQYRLWGRTGAADDRLYLFWTGSSLEFNLRATELWVTLESSYMVFENWVDVLVNGELIQRFMVPQGRSEFCLFRGMDRSKARRVQIVRDTQAMHLDARNSLAICSVRTDAGIYRGQPDFRRRPDRCGGLSGMESRLLQRNTFVCVQSHADAWR